MSGGVPRPHHKAARRDPLRRRRRHRRRHPWRPPDPPAPHEGIFLPFADEWRPYYRDASNIRCGPFALCEMLSVHYGRTFDPEQVWDGIGGTTGSSVWDNVQYAKGQGWIRDFRFFRDDGGRSPVENARATLAQGLAFMVICNYYNSGHIWCVTGIDDTARAILSPQDWGAPADVAVPFEDFDRMVMQLPPFEAPSGYAVCCAGLFA